jgi:quinol monooxygenase YgiN
VHGLIGHFRAKPGRRDDMVRAMTQGGYDIPGLVAFHVALDPADPDAIWVTEVWVSREAHAASMDVPLVAASMPLLMAVWQDAILHTETVPVVGKGF